MVIEDFIENPDGSATMTIILTDEEKHALIQEGFNAALRELIETTP